VGLIQQRLYPVNLKYELPKGPSIDGADLKVIGHCDDGFDYALKRPEDGQFLPITEWVCYHLCRAVGIATPDFAIVNRAGALPAFGSRWEHDASQLEDLQPFSIAAFFAHHIARLASIYTLDAALPNVDRHGRNMMTRHTSAGDVLLAFDFSRAWLQTGTPFGDLSRLNGSNTSEWWSYFHSTMSVNRDDMTLAKIEDLPAKWLCAVFRGAPAEWVKPIPIRATLRFWKHDRTGRCADASKWLS
jgi:hypothetical protein